MLYYKPFLWKLPFSRIATCQIAAFRLYHLPSVFFQDLLIILCHRIFVHTRVHCRSDELRTLTGKHCRCQHIVRNAMRQLRHDIRRSWSDKHEIRPLCKLHMLYLKLKIAVKRIGQTLISGQRFKRHRSNELLRIFRHDHMYVRMLLFQKARQIRRLVRSNTSRHTENDCFSF